VAVPAAGSVTHHRPYSIKLVIKGHGAVHLDAGRIVGMGNARRFSCTAPAATAATCSATIKVNTAKHLKLRAIPASGWKFASWKGCRSSTNTCTLTLPHKVKVVATLSPPPSGFVVTTLDGSRGVASATSATTGADGLGLISYEVVHAPNLDLKVAHCKNLACSRATTTVLDGSDGVLDESSITIGADGLGLISYSATDGNNYDLKVAHCNDVACSSATIHTLASGSDDRASAIAVGADGLGLISYVDEASRSLKVAHCDNVACSNATVATLDTDNVAPAAIAIGADDLGLIVYGGQTTGDMRVAHCDNVACSIATITSLVSSAAGVSGPGAITIGSDGLALITYGPGGVKVAHCSNLICTSATETTSGSAGSGEIAIGGDGLPVITYTDGTSIKVAHCSDSTCTTMTTANVYTNAYHVFPPSFTIGADGLPLIAYQDPSYDNLIVAHCPNVFCTH
jgi:hypothetical protein